MVHIGDIVERKPVTFGNSPDGKTQLIRGTVVYVHPLGRFHVVEFFPKAESRLAAGLTNGVRKHERRGVRESFLGVEK